MHVEVEVLRSKITQVITGSDVKGWSLVVLIACRHQPVHAGLVLIDAVLRVHHRASSTEAAA